MSSYPALDLYVLTYNCAHNLISIPHFSSNLFNAIDHLPDLLVISLQEATPMSYGLIGGSFVTPYTNRVEDAVEVAARKLSGINPPRGSPPIYTKVAQRSIGMVILMAFALDPEAVKNVRGGEVGLGVSGMANKGAAGLRFEYEDHKTGGSTELCFVAAHLAAMETELERRNEDWKNIVKDLVLTPEGDDGKGPKGTANGNAEVSEESQALITAPKEEGIFSPTSHLFLAGDLNYRTSVLKPAPGDHLESFPQPHFPRSDCRHCTVYHEKDQLNQERAAGRTMHGLNEFPINFPPTYKYESYDKTTEDENGGEGHWAWAEHRWPSWTDRILYLDIPSWLSSSSSDPKPNIALGKYDCLPLFPTSDHRAVVLSVKVPLIPIPEPQGEEDRTDPRINPPFEREPEWRAKRALARKEELMVGISAFLTGSWEGWVIVLGTLAGFIGGYFLLRAALDM